MSRPESERPHPFRASRLMIALEPLGDRAFLARFATEGDAARWVDAVRARERAGIIDIVLAYATAAVFADPDRVDLIALETELRAAAPASLSRPPGRLVSLPVLYDGDDLSAIAKRLYLSESEVVALHSGQDYLVFAIGFVPGFPYAGDLPGPLRGLPRRESPRLRVPAGSVAIAGRQTGVYPNVSPGGWHLVGRTPLRIVDVETGHFPIRAGDRIRFEPIDSEDFRAREGDLL